jgi:hypothetical protein
LAKITKIIIEYLPSPPLQTPPIWGEAKSGLWRDFAHLPSSLILKIEPNIKNLNLTSPPKTPNQKHPY